MNGTYRDVQSMDIAVFMCSEQSVNRIKVNNQIMGMFKNCWMKFEFFFWFVKMHFLTFTPVGFPPTMRVS